MNRDNGWALAGLVALLAVLIVLGLFYYWFAIADRYIIFLYDHGMPPEFPDTSAFSRITSSRYWMAGLVASGLVMVLYTTANLILGRMVDGYRPPAWWRAWLLCVLPLVLFIPFITMTTNQPVLPLVFTLPVVLVTLFGLALAFSPGRVAAERPAELLLLTFDGLGLMLIMLFVSMMPRLFELSARGLPGFIVVAVLGVAAGSFLLLLVSAIRIWRRMSVPGALAVFTAGLCVAYPLMVLVHHLYVGLAGGYFYISDSDNFFGRSPWSTLVAWIVAFGLAFGITKLRQQLISSRSSPTIQAATQKKNL